MTRPTDRAVAHAVQMLNRGLMADGPAVRVARHDVEALLRLLQSQAEAIRIQRERIDDQEVELTRLRVQCHLLRDNTGDSHHDHE